MAEASDLGNVENGGRVVSSRISLVLEMALQSSTTWGRKPVVDKYCRVHDIDNVYAIDGSVHVTNGGFNPVFTIMAVAY